MYLFTRLVFILSLQLVLIHANTHMYLHTLILTYLQFFNIVNISTA